ncbi:transcriptional regulator, TetR family [Phenylobacterium zucineum HLK1]|uniref:Transcriptional regulator, TetR family n=1 Tax=Phenylobacterium zucineum (strain HLK1) TaxID=450851 RepID=B4RAL9_PHEZH|nr:TetR/AcrR family transcriptional regulator [Phenylobacterium zucineum]ACG79617.1 transcriptional regulator, TetR family [Phenylobacterium zucineum HLK1]
MAPRGAAARSTDRFERKREAILDAATRILNRKGVKGLTLSDAAAAVDLSTTSVTYYFKRKDDLAAACIIRGVEALHDMAEQALAPATPSDRLHRLLTLYFERMRQTVAEDAAPLPVISDMRALSSPRREEASTAYGKLFRKVRQIFDTPDLAWMSRGRRTARTRMLLEQLFWAQTWLPKYDPEDYSRVRDRMHDILVHGVAAPGDTWTPQPIPMEELAAREGPELARETFLLAATRLINKRGYRGASVDKISAELNVTKGSFYHHNEAKDDLVVACFERTFEVMRRAQRLAMELPGNQWERLCACAAALAEFQLSEHGPLLRTSALTALPEQMRRQMVEHANRVSDRFASMISDGIAEGSIRPVDPVIAAQMLNATLNACADLGALVPDVRPKAAPAVFAKPMMMGVFLH